MASQKHDVVVVGSSFGGGAAAYNLAKAGFKVLVLERGSYVKRDDDDWNPRKILVEQRYKAESPIFVKQYSSRRFKPQYPSENIGGMSVFYGGATLRLRKTDFERWPISYAELEPYYVQAEKLLEVHGTAGDDPTEPPRSTDYAYTSEPLTEPAQRIHTAAEKLGYSPFKIPMALNFRNSKREKCIKCNTCDGYPCKIKAKNEVTTTFLEKAKGKNLKIRDGIIAESLSETNGRITEVRCVDKATGKRLSFQADKVIISAGALQSPAILLRSGLERYENHDFIGRYLMRHFNCVITALFPFKTNPEGVFHKQVCISSFYEDLRKELGTATGIIQDIFSLPPDVVKEFAPSGLRTAASLFAERMQNLMCIAEDTPQRDNRVTLSGNKDRYGIETINVRHKYCKEDYVRRNYLVRRAKRVLMKAGGLPVFAFNIPTFSHAVGTLRFGSSPAEAVLDRDCRFFGIDNLYALDASFMPTPGAVNPSLTIAANSLRVADKIISGD